MTDLCTSTHINRHITCWRWCSHSRWRRAYTVTSQAPPSKGTRATAPANDDAEGDLLPASFDLALLHTSSAARAPSDEAFRIPPPPPPRPNLLCCCCCDAVGGLPIDPNDRTRRCCRVAVPARLKLDAYITTERKVHSCSEYYCYLLFWL